MSREERIAEAQQDLQRLSLKEFVLNRELAQTRRELDAAAQKLLNLGVQPINPASWWGVKE